MEEMDVLNQDGVYEVYHVRAGLAYDGWYLVMTASPRPDGGIWAEAFALPRDLPGPPAAIAQGYVDFSSRFVLDHHRESGLLALNMERQKVMRGDEDHPLQTIQVPNEALRRMWLSTFPMPDDNPFRELYRRGLRQLAASTHCRALRSDMKSWLHSEELGL